MVGGLIELLMDGLEEWIVFVFGPPLEHQLK
jgi:hypothetical protein